MINLEKKNDTTFEAYLVTGEYIGYIEKERKRKYEDGCYVSYGDYFYRVHIAYEIHCGSDYGYSHDEEWYPTLSAARYAFERTYKEKNYTPHKKEAEKAEVKFLTSMRDSEFYPTPSKLVGIMLAGLKNIDSIKTVLEPSAGKGDILDNMGKMEKNIVGYGRNHPFAKSDIDCIELDENLRYILNGKGYKVVYDDFLKFNTIKKYDLVIMNPPFSNGAAHLLKAIDIQKDGGQICCLLNAETLLNPYTNERKVLLQLIQKFNGSVKYVRNAFSHAERKTDVTVAIVWFDIPVKTHTSKILEGLEKAEEEYFHTNDDVTELALGDFVENLVSGFQKECKACKELILEYEAIKPYILDTYEEKIYSSPIIELKVLNRNYDNINEAINKCIKAIRLKYWTRLLTNEELMNMFTTSLRRSFVEMKDEMAEYDFNVYNIKLIIARMNAEMFSGLERCIYSLFDTLSDKHSYSDDYNNGNIHYYNGWKTNKAHYVNQKVILPCYGVFSSYTDRFDVYHAHSALADIEKSLNYLDGHATEYVDLFNCINNYAGIGVTRKIPCKYFYVTFYKKGTMHVQFRKEFAYLIDALNIFVGKGRNWLPPSYGKKRYKDMTEEEKRVIDEFQGMDKYEQVMDNPDLFLFEPSSSNILMLTEN